MDERWQEIERIYHAALEREESARAAFVAQACAGDPALRDEVEFLLAQDEKAGSFLESPAIEVVAESVAAVERLSYPSKAALELGAMVAHYRLTAKIGEGGMGEVYRARDTRLQRDVALKILPQALAHDADRMARFEREAQVLASLNHPNIAAIHGLEESNGIRALVMELVEGETLEERLRHPQPLTRAASRDTLSPPAGRGEKPADLTPSPRGRGWSGRAGPGEGSRGSSLAIDDALPIARQIAEALEYAHEHGVIHRDLKPANVKITPEGTVKVLDFGLAKVLNPQESSAALDAAKSPTVSTMATHGGMLLGTAAYMSPEQAKGQRVDRRCDIWAFGCVLYEMLSGRKAFDGETISDLLAAVTKSEPDWNALPGTTPFGIQKLIRRCLQKDVRQRLQAIGDARIAIEETLSQTDTVAPGFSPADADLKVGATTGDHRSPLRRALPWAVAMLLIILTAGAYWLSHPPPKPQVNGMVQLTHDGQIKYGPLLTDGSRVYFGEGTSDRAQVSVQGGEVAPAGPISVPQAYPQGISADGSEFLVIQFITSADLAPLWIAPVLAGSPRRVGNLVVNSWVEAAGQFAQAAAWSPDMQRIAFAKGNNLYTAGPDGSSVQELASLPGEGFAVQWKPDGSGLDLSVMDTKTGAKSLWELRAVGANLHELLPGWNNPPAECCGVWTPDGKYLIFQATRQGLTTLWALPQETGLFSRASRQPIQLTTGPMDMESPVISRDGRKIFTLGIQPRGRLARYDAPSKRFVPYLGGDSIDHVDFSKDGKWITYLSYPEGYLWRRKADGSEKVQLTFPPLQALLPRWSPDGKQIAFIGLKPGVSAKIYIVPAGGGEPERVLPQDNAEEYDPVWSPDGNRLVFPKNPFAEVHTPQERDLEMVDLKTRQVMPVPGSQGLYSARWSPDGRYLVAMPRDSVRLELFDFNSQKWQELAKIVIGFPSWSRDSQYVYFNDLNNTAIYRVRVSDRKVDKVASLAGMTTTSSWWTGLAPDDSPMILLDTSIDQIYALDWTAP